LPISVPAGAIRHTGGCLQPVLLRGRADYIDGGTGELIHRYTTVYEPGGVLPIACKTRRASRCPPCAEVYRADTYQLIRAGLTGGEGIPATVADHPCVFVTLTAPSFGPVHARREKNGRVLACRPRRKDKTCPHGARSSCGDKHDRNDHRLGEPLCPDCYDYAGAVLFNAYAPELWRRFTITLRRTLARQAGLTGKTLASDRAAHEREYAVASGRQPDFDPGTTLVVTDWHYAGRGDPPAADIPLPRGGPPCRDSC
jgi:hypothetical protein